MPNADAPDQNTSRLPLRWAIATLPLAPLALVFYLFFEWLFIVTKPTPTASLPLSAQLLVLLKSPLSLVLPFLTLQGVASLVSLVAYPRFRAIAILPAGVVCGLLLLMLIDNFTYTMFGIGVLRAGEAFRVGYTVLFGVLTAAAGWKLESSLGRIFHRSGALAAAVVATVVFAGSAVITAEPPLPRDPDATVLPNLRGTNGGTERPNIMFLGVDGLEAPLLSVYGYDRPTTPFLESIREDTLFFENAFSNASRTHGALVTLLTGRLPFTTHVTFPPTVLQGEDGNRTLPVILKGLGYTTLQLGMRHYADAEDTNVQGFDAANYRWQRLDELKPSSQSGDPTDVFRAAVAERIDERLGHLFGLAPAVDAFAHVEGRQIAPQWRDERRVTTLAQYFKQAPEPWFVHLHLLDTHCCQWVPDHMHFSGGSSPLVDARDSQIRETDENVKRLFAALQSSGRLERTMVVIMSDHASEWKITERVPLMIRFPGRSSTGSIAANVQLADVAPTVLSYLGASIPDWMDGQSLFPVTELSPTRLIFGVSDVKAFAGPSGFRSLLDSSAPNYGVSAVMMVAGNRWFEISLASGAFESGDVRGHTGSAPAMREAEARQHLTERIRSAGFQLEQPEAGKLTAH